MPACQPQHDKIANHLLTFHWPTALRPVADFPRMDMLFQHKAGMGMVEGMEPETR